MVKTLQVYLLGSYAGVLEQTLAGDISFTYDQAYRSEKGKTPLSLSMPLSAEHHKKRAVLPFLQGLLPDSDPALQVLGSRFGVPWRNPCALLEHVGSDVAGAIEIFPNGGKPPARSHEQAEAQVLSELEVGRMLRGVVAEYQTGIPGAVNSGYFSVAGAQPKISLRRDGDMWALPDSANPTTHILKPVPGNFEHLDLVEYLTMSVAGSLGMTVAQCELMTIDGIECFATTRYDRPVVDGRVVRLHQEDFAQALSVSPGKKYQHRDGGPGLRAIGALLSSLPETENRKAVARNFFRGFVFNVIAGCTDAHAKNYSLILEGNQVRLAPLYDLVTYAGYWDGESTLMSAMSVGGKYALEQISSDMLVEAGWRLGLESEASEIVDSLREQVGGVFDKVLGEIATDRPGGGSFLRRLGERFHALPLVV